MKNEQVVQLPLNRLTEFPEHPFKVRDDEFMDQLTDSIRSLGVLTPIVVRPEGDAWQIISGHRRVMACRKAGISEIPALVVSLDRDAAAIVLVDSNLHRERSNITAGHAQTCAGSIHVYERPHSKCGRENPGEYFPDRRKIALRPGKTCQEKTDWRHEQEHYKYSFTVTDKRTESKAENHACGDIEQQQDNDAAEAAVARKSCHSRDNDGNIDTYCHVNQPVSHSSTQDAP